MATREELREALDDYVMQAQKSERVVRSIRNWHCVIYIEASDLNGKDKGFTMIVGNSETKVQDGTHEKPDLIIRGSSEDLTDIFWCDQNPASNYMQGAIKVQGSQENIMRLDAMSLLIYLEVKK